jgi:hypothetical protein
LCNLNLDDRHLGIGAAARALGWGGGQVESQTNYGGGARGTTGALQRQATRGGQSAVVARQPRPPGSDDADGRASYGPSGVRRIELASQPAEAGVTLYNQPAVEF